MKKNESIFKSDVYRINHCDDRSNDFPNYLSRGDGRTLGITELQSVGKGKSVLELSRPYDFNCRKCEV